MNEVMWNKIDTRILVYGAEWDSCSSSIKAKIFGRMVKLAQDKVEYFTSDLYHDAIWLDKTLGGPCQFEWSTNQSGTHIGESVQQYVLPIYGSNVNIYRFEIVCEDNLKWVLNIYEAVKERKIEATEPVASIVESVFPTLRNTNQIKEKCMEEILSQLRDKLDEANSARDEAYDAKSDLDDAISEFDTYIDTVDDLISSLENLPEISVDLDFRVSFES